MLSRVDPGIRETFCLDLMDQTITTLLFRSPLLSRMDWEQKKARMSESEADPAGFRFLATGLVCVRVQIRLMRFHPTYESTEHVICELGRGLHTR